MLRDFHKMQTAKLIEAFGALGKRTASHPLMCACADCKWFMEIADAVAHTPTAEIRAAVRELAEEKVAMRKAA